MRTSYYGEQEMVSEDMTSKGVTRDGLKSEMESMIDILMPKLDSHDEELSNGLSFEEKVKAFLLNKDNPEEERREVLHLYKKREEQKKFNKLEFFKPYEFQKKFYAASKDYRFRMLLAGNRCGKTVSEAYEFAMHATGKYPKWWNGIRFTKAPLMWAVGNTSDSTRNVLQKELLGTSNAKMREEIGTGTIPKRDIDFGSGLSTDGERVKSLKVKFHNSKGEWTGTYTEIKFYSVGQGQGTMMGQNVNFIWMDEFAEHDADEVHNQLITRVGTTNGQVVTTGTPEYGLNPVIEMFQKNEDGNLYIQTATWSDCPHFTRKMMRDLLGATPKSKWRMRAMGEPFFAGGLVYDLDPDEYTVKGFEIPNHWKVVCGMDLGYSHDTTAVWTAYDKASDTIYVIDEYSAKGRTPEEHARYIKPKGEWIPVILPKDALNTEKSSGLSALKRYQDVGVNVLNDVFYNPDTLVGHAQDVENGIHDIGIRMMEGRFKIFSHCSEVIEGIRQYRRKTDGSGKVVRVNDDLVDAMRYSSMSVTHRGKSYDQSNAPQVSYNRWKRN